MSKARDLANAGTALTTVSATELGYLDGVTSAVQTQINAKQAVVSGVNDTEIGYLDGVTSAIQTQINAQIPKSTVTTKGDILVATGSGTLVAQGVGANGTVLTANSAQADGVEWVAPGGALTLATITSGSISSGTSLTLSSLSSYDTLTLILNGIAWGSTPDSLRIRINGSSSAVYANNTVDEPESKSFDTQFSSANNQTQIPLTLMNANAGGSIFTILKLTNCKQSGFTTYQHMNQYYQNDSSTRVVTNSGIFLSSAAVSSLVLSTTTGLTFTAGNYQLIGA
jgi:hypothetical protein